MTESGFATLSGREDLLTKTIERNRSNGHLAPHYLGIAQEFARDLQRHSPFVRAIALSGSTASGGVGDGDDIDVNLIAEPGTKYTVYLLALLLGVKYSLRYGRRFANGSSRLGPLPKVTCVNVVWTEDQCRPFVRQDAPMAFELMRSVPIAGTEAYREMLAANTWLEEHFPQIFDPDDAGASEAPAPTPLAQFQRRIAASPRGRRAMDGLAKAAARVLHRLVDLTRERNPAARERSEFLRRSKFPYDVFQD